MGLLDCVYPCCVGHLRYIIVLLSFIGINIAYFHRIVLNIGIVEMNGAAHGAKNKSQTICPPPAGSGNSTIANIGGGDVGWTNRQQNLILGSFYIGYVLMHIPGGIAADVFGARWPLIIANTASTAITAAIPVMSKTLPWWSIFVLRMFQGASQGVHFPAYASLVGQWIPPPERATVGAIVFAAGSVGTVIGNFATGMMIRGLRNWVYPFYFWTLIGMLYTIGCFFYLYSSPTTNPHITDMELNYLQSLMPTKEKARIPVKRILADACIYGLVIAQCGHNLIIFTMLSNLPKYLNNVLGFNIVLNALTALLYFGQLISGFIFGKLADYVVMKKNANVSFMRKLYTVVSNVVAGFFLIVAGECRCNYAWALVALGLCIFWKGLFFPGMKVNIIDVTVNHNGLVMSIVNGIGAITGVVGSHLVALMVPDNSHVQWRYFFIMVFSVQIFTSLCYVLMSNSTRRKWDYMPGETPPERKKPKKWYLQMTPSDHQLRLEKNRKVLETRAEATRQEKQVRKERKEAKKAEKQAAREASRVRT